MNYFDLPYNETAPKEVSITRGIVRYLDTDEPLSNRLMNWPDNVSMDSINERLWEVMDAGRWLSDVSGWTDIPWKFACWRAHIYLNTGEWTTPD